MARDGTRLTNKELSAVYDFLNGAITQVALAHELGKTRTNTYYYIGVACRYWLSCGILKFNGDIKKRRDVGGSDVKL